MWEGWARELGGQARLISVDLPGHGLTGAWPRDEYTVEAYADFIEVLVDTLNLDRFVLAGHSLGGGVAWTFAATRPDRVSQLILVDAGYPAEGREPRMADQARAPADGRRYRHLLQARAVGAAHAEPGLCRSGDGDGRAREAHRRTATLSRQPRGHPAARPHPGAARSDAAQAAERADTNPMGREGPLGAGCRRLPLPNDIKGAKLEIFEKLGHSPMEEDPKPPPPPCRRS